MYSIRIWISRFATTSIPKKVTVVTPTPEESIENTSGNGADGTSKADSEVAAEKSKVQQDEKTAGLQRLVEKHQDKTEKEILRTLKV